MGSVMQELLDQLQEHQCRGRIVSVRHVCDLSQEVERHRSRGLLGEEFYQERLAWFDFRPPDSLPGAASLIVLAVPRPQTRVIFNWNGHARALIIPPTYVAYDRVRRQMQDLLTGFLAPKGYRVDRTALPLKLLAAHSGLVEYGRNNVTYIPGGTSFHELVAFYSDLPCQEDTWQEAQMMASCQNCHACIKHCPTDAIPSDRFLLRAERCIVFHNEKAGGIPFPAWMDLSWHNCLVGCMHCQRVCPQNRDVLDWVEESAEFSQEETTLLLAGTPLDQLDAETVKKLERLDLVESLDTLPRNLGVFFGARRDDTVMAT